MKERETIIVLMRDGVTSLPCSVFAKKMLQAYIECSENKFITGYVTDARLHHGIDDVLEYIYNEFQENEQEITKVLFNFKTKIIEVVYDNYLSISHHMDFKMVNSLAFVKVLKLLTNNWQQKEELDKYLQRLYGSDEINEFCE